MTSHENRPPKGPESDNNSISTGQVTPELTGYAHGAPIYWNAGWRGVIPVHPANKGGVPKGFTGHDGAEPSYPDILQWSEVYPDHNLSLRLQADQLGIDVDAYDAKTGAQTLAEAEKRWGPLPPTYVSTSRGDGVSGIRLYRIPAGLKFPDRIVFPELGIGDIEFVQRHHRHISCYPSIHHKTGRQYRWIDQFDGTVMDAPPTPGDLPDLPQAWIDGLRSDSPSDVELGAVTTPYDTVQAVTEGRATPRVAERLNDAINDCYSPSRHDNTRDHSLALLRFGEQGDSGVGGALVILRSVFITAVTEDGSRTPAEAAEEFRRMIDNPRVSKLLAEKRWDPFRGSAPAASPAAAGQGTTPAQVSVLDQLARGGVWLDQQMFAPLEYAVDGIIPEGCGLLVAPPKKGKSFLVADVGLAVAAGGLALGAIVCKQRPVLYLALEDGHRRLQDRSRRILRGGAIPAGISFVTTATPSEAIASMGEFIARHRDSKPLLILDTFGKVRPAKRPGEDAYQADYAVGAHLKGLVDAAPGSTLLIVHHTRKAEAVDFVDSVSGTQGIAGSVDFVMALNRQRHANDAILAVTGRDVVEAEYALTADDGILWRLDGASLAAASGAVEHRRAAEKMSNRQMDVLRFVEKSEDAVTATEVAKALTDMDGDTAGKYLRRLQDAGYVAKVGRGQYLRTVSEVSEPDTAAGQDDE